MAVRLLARIAASRRSLPPVFWTVWLGTLINRLGGFVVPLLTFYLTAARGLSIGQAGAIVSLYGAGAVGAALAGGVLADRVGRRATMLASLFGGAICMLALGLAHSLPAIAVCTLALGFMGELYRPAVLALVADVVPGPDRLRAFGLLYWAINLGFGASALVAGVIAGWSYLALFIGDAATMAAYGVIVFLRVPETRPAVASRSVRQTGLRDVVTDRVFMTFVGLIFLMMLVPFQSSVSLSAYMATQGHSAAEYGAVLAVNGILIVLLQPSLIHWLGRFDRSRTLAAACAVTGAGFFVHGLVASLPFHVVAVMIWTVGEIAASPAGSETVANLAPIETRGRYQGVYSMAFGLAACIGPFAGSRLLDDVGPTALWTSCLLLTLAVAFGVLATAPPRRARTSAAAQPPSETASP